MPKPSLILSFFAPKAAHAKWLLFLLLCGLLVLGYYGYLPQIKEVLDQKAYSYKISGFRISPYIVLKGLLTIIVLFWVAGIINEFAGNRIHGINSLKSSTRVLISKIVQIGIYAVCGLLTLKVVGIDLTALAVFGGAVGIGVGLGLQKIVSNFVSGLILLSEKTLNLDDLVELGDGTAGYVRQFGARHTLIEAFDGREILIPNEDFITNRLINWTYNNKRARVDITIGVAYGSDLELAQKLMLEAATEHPLAMKDPAPGCWMREFADSSINFLLIFWVPDVTEGRFGPQSEVMFSIWKKFQAHNIEIPFPQRDVHIRNAS